MVFDRNAATDSLPPAERRAPPSAPPLPGTGPIPPPDAGAPTGMGGETPGAQVGTPLGGNAAGNQDAFSLPADLIGDIPPPPVPGLPVGMTSGPAAAIQGSGVAGIRGTEAGTFSRPGSRGAQPFHTERFGPGVGAANAGTTPVGLGLTPQEAADLLRRMAGGM